jgi:RNA recognition motif-containing protein
MNIYVGNLAHAATEDNVREAFAAFGQVASVNIIKDRFSGAPRGFCFVEMPNESEARAAIAGLNDREIVGRPVKVNEARPKTDSRGGGGGGRPRY